MFRSFERSHRFSKFLEARFRQARPGSVLIVVVALLVLMALMGTAYITSARVDRYSAQQNSFNTEIDLLLQAVVQMEQDLIRTASNAPSSAPVGPTYHHWNSPSDENWWGSRVPVLMASNQPGWRFIAVSPTGVPFESPYSLNGQPVTYTTRENLAATSIPVTVNGQIVQYPAFFDASSGQTYLAASASGDGIVDAGLWRIPIGELNGITYYAAVRVLDNNSALDASIAESRNAVAASLPGDFFPANVDLQSLLVGGAGELAQLDQYRFNAAAASLLPLSDSGAPMPFQFLSVYDAMWHQLGRRYQNPGWNVPGARYQSLSASDAIALAYRFCVSNSSASASVVERALQSSLLNTPGNSKFVPTSPFSPDQVARWYAQDFAFESETPGSPATYLPRRALMAAHTPVSNFAPNRYSDKGAFFSNPVANATPAQKPWDPKASYIYGDWVRFDNRSYVCIRPTGGGAVGAVLPVGQTESDADPSNPQGPPLTVPISQLVWAPQPWIDYPTRTGINTAQFAQLWLAFWNVMADTQSSVPAGTDTRMFRNPMRSAVAVNTTANGNSAAPAAGATIAVAPTGGDDTASIQAAINSSPPGATLTFAGNYNISSTLSLLGNRTYTGGPGGGAIAGLTPYQTLQLRAALAAVNAEQLRVSSLSTASPYDVISRSISIGGTSTPGPTTSGSATFTWTGGDNLKWNMAATAGNNISILGINFVGGDLWLTNTDSTNVLENSFTTSKPTMAVFVNTVSNCNVCYNNFTNSPSATGIGSQPTHIIGSHFDWNTFDNALPEDIHLDFGDDGLSQNNSVSYNVTNGERRNFIELQGTSGGGLKVMHNYGGALSIATQANDSVEYAQALGHPPTPTIGNEVGFNVILGSLHLGQNSMGLGALENYGSGTNIHDNYFKQWGTGVYWDATGWAGQGVQWYVTNNIFVGCNTAVDSGPEGFGPTSGPYADIPPTQSGNQVYPLGAGPPPPPPPVFDGSSSSVAPPVTSDVALNYTVSVFGSAPQPYITEVYANNDPSTQTGYMAVELYNPYNVDIVMNNWRLATINRSVGSLFALVPSPLTSTTSWQASPPTIKAGGRLVLVSSATPPSSVSNPPKPDSNSSVLVVNDLTSAFDQELVLLRPRRADGTLWWMTANPADQNLTDPTQNHYDPTNLYDERSNVGDFVPLDSYDFTGLPASSGTSASAEWHYVRPNDPAQKAWHFVYPGKYTSADALAANPNLTPNAQQPRLVGTDVVSPARTNGIDLSTVGQPDTTQTNKPNYQDFALQVNNTDFGGPKVKTFPHGGFARNGDMLQVTYVGAYTIKVSTNLAIVEMNPITMDSAFADDTDAGDDAAENIGRFTPIHPADLGFGINDPAAPFNDFHPAGLMPAPSNIDWSTKWSAYHFATRFFDFLTVQAPHDDYLPNISPNNPDGSANTMVQPVANADSNIVNALTTNTPLNSTEDNVPIEGLININTAPWRVLSALPMANDPATNAQLAQAIVYYRDVDDGSLGAGNPHPHGPFQSLWDLNGVPGFRTTLSTYAGTYNPATSIPVNTDGYLTPYAGTTPGGTNQAGFVYNDFETQNLALTRISNLVTTRSDVFTVYVLVQGFRNAGTANPELMVQRRAAFIADRSRIIPTNTALTILNVPTN